MKANTKKIRSYSGELRRIKKQVPWLIAKTLNDVAFFGKQTAWPQEVKSAMAIRTPWTMRSMRVDRATAQNLVSILGSVEPYMKTQEFGATEGKKGKHGVPIPAASPGGRAARKRVVAKKLRMSAISTVRTEGGGSSKQRNAVALRKARKAGGGVVFLELGTGNKGLYRVTSNRRPKKLWDLTKGSVTIPRNPTLEKAAHRAAMRGERTFKKRFFSEVAYSARKLK